jgi:hypothetical protein
MVIKKCITVTEDQDDKIRALQMRRMANEKKNISYSKIIQMAITEGLKQL